MELSDMKMMTADVQQKDRNLIVVEAALYVAGKPVEANTLSSILGFRSRIKARELARKLADAYLRFNGPLEVVELEDDRFVLQLKPEYVAQVKRFSIQPILTKGPRKTLAYIAYNQPIVQSKVIAVRGGHAYKHIRELGRRGLITTEKFGRTKIIRITDRFLNFFNLSRNRRLMRRQLRALFNV